MLNDEQKQLIQKGAKAFTTMLVALGCLVVTVALGLLSGQIDTYFEWLNGSFTGGLVISVIALIFFIIFFVSFAVYNNAKGAPELEYLPGSTGLDEPANVNKLASTYGLKKFNIGIIILCFVLLIPVFVFSAYDEAADDIKEAFFGEELEEDDDDKDKDDKDDRDHSDDEDDDFESTPMSEEDVQELYRIEKLLKQEGYAVYNTLEYSENDGYASLYVSVSENQLFKVDLDLDYSDVGLSHIGLSYNCDPKLSEKNNIKAANKAFAELAPVIQLLYDEGYLVSDAALDYISFPDEFVDLCVDSEEEQSYHCSIDGTSDSYDEVYYSQYIWSEDDMTLSISFWNF